MNNPFQLFDIETQYFIDKQAVNEKYIALQKQFHPDNFATRTAKEKLMATQISANVVSAHKTLLDPIARASALLNLWGKDFDLANYISNDQSLLITQMELREQLDTANTDEYPALKQAWEKDFSNLEQEFANYLTDKDLDKAAEIVLKMRYYQKLLTELDHKD
ncbi:MAG: Fe-S protein assembly co-chaperone HscB [Gammaproteobacteria bacterium]|nr:Fe-S protein assembly co-chaperone HscB [Gammaproteobacteria bacterium]